MQYTVICRYNIKHKTNSRLTTTIYHSALEARHTDIQASMVPRARQNPNQESNNNVSQTPRTPRKLSTIVDKRGPSAVAVLCGNGAECEVLQKHYPTRAAADAYAERCSTWWQITEPRAELWKLEARSFSAFCADNWGFTKQRVSQLLICADVMEALPENCQPWLTNERQARALGEVPAERREEVLQSAISTSSLNGKVLKALTFFGWKCWSNWIRQALAAGAWHTTE